MTGKVSAAMSDGDDVDGKGIMGSRDDWWWCCCCDEEDADHEDNDDDDEEEEEENDKECSAPLARSFFPPPK